MPPCSPSLPRLRTRRFGRQREHAVRSAGIARTPRGRMDGLATTRARGGGCSRPNAHAHAGAQLERLPAAVLALVLCKAGAWRSDAPRGCGADSGGAGSIDSGAATAAWSVCRAWRDVLLTSEHTLAALLLEVHGPRGALLRALLRDAPRLHGFAIARR
eukprot:231065-Chlamydomonas_euryale.AAC.1